MNTRLLNVTLEFFHILLAKLKARNYIPTEKEALCVLPLLCERVGHNQPSIRQQLSEGLKKFLLLYYGPSDGAAGGHSMERSLEDVESPEFGFDAIPPKVLLTLVRGRARAGKNRLW